MASTAPAPTTLAAVLDQINATPEQRAEVKQVIKDGGDQWRAWIQRHRDDLATLRKSYHDAATAGKTEEANQLKKEYIAIVNTIPKAPQVWDKAKSVFPLDQQKQLNAMEAGKKPGNMGVELLNHTLHDAARSEFGEHLMVGDQPYCVTCHLPIVTNH